MELRVVEQCTDRIFRLRQWQTEILKILNLLCWEKAKNLSSTVYINVSILLQKRLRAGREEFNFAVERLLQAL